MPIYNQHKVQFRIFLNELLTNKVNLKKKPENIASTSKVAFNPKTLVKGRTLKLSTAENWKQTSLAKYDGQKWLVINADKSGCVVSLQCSVCEKYSNKIRGIFSPVWACEGTTNLRLSNAEDHAQGEPHKRALFYMRMAYQLKSQWKIKHWSLLA